MNKILLALLLLTFSLNAGEKIRLLAEIFPPFQYTIEGRLIGISTDIVNAIQKEIGAHEKIEIYPWTRALKIVNKKKNTAIFSMHRTKEREHKYKWVGPLIFMKIMFFKKKGSSITLNNIEDAKKVGKIGVTNGVANFEMLNAQGFKNLDVMPSGPDEQNIRKLVNGKIDLWFGPLMAGLYNARLMGLSGEIVPIKNVIASGEDLYIAFNIKTDDIIVKRWQKALDKLKKNKSIEKIIKRYK